VKVVEAASCVSVPSFDGKAVSTEDFPVPPLS